jgi:spore maturation protein CgeB
MGLRLLTISTFYPGNLASFYKNHKDFSDLSFRQLNDLIISETTEFAGSYNRTFNRLGLDAGCIIVNDTFLQNKWAEENNKNADSKSLIIYEQVRKFKPEILWIENISTLDTDWIKKIKKEVRSIKLVVAYHCSPYNVKLIKRFKEVDFVFTCTPGIKEDLEKHGIKVFQVYHGFDADFIKKKDQKNITPGSNLIFSGSLSLGGGFHSERLKLIESLIKEDIGIDLYVNLEKLGLIRAKQILHSISSLLMKMNIRKVENSFSFLQNSNTPIYSYSRELLRIKKPPVFGMEMYELFRNAKIVLNSHGGAAGDFAGNMRMFEVTGLGSCLLTDNKQNLNELFDVGSEIIGYENIEDCIEKAKWLLKNDNEREKIAYKGQQKTLRYHTIEIRCKSIIDILKNELLKI